MDSDELRFAQALTQALEPWKLSLTSAQVGQLFGHFRTMVDSNQVMNLTRITDPVEAAVKHYADSLATVTWARDARIWVRTMLDIGTGAGFPAFPLAVARPEWEVTAIDGTRKRIDFVAATAKAMGLTNLHAVHAHSDHWASATKYDLVVARALGTLGECADAAGRFLQRGGWLVAYKTPGRLAIEAREAAAALRRNAYVADAPFEYTPALGADRLSRILAVYRKGGSPPERVMA